MGSLLKDRRAIALLLAATLTIMSNAIISPGLAGIADHFRDTPNAGLLTRLLVTAPSLLVAICAPIAGHFADSFGRKRMIMTGAALFAIAGTGGLWLPTLPLLLASRLLLGLAVALVMAPLTALAAEYFHGPVRGKFMALQMAFMSYGGVVFIGIAGDLAGHSAFLPFVLYFVGLIYLPVMAVSLSEPAHHDHATAHAQAGGGGQPGWGLMLGVALFLGLMVFVGYYIVPTQIAFYMAEIGHPEPMAASIVLVAAFFASGSVTFIYPKLRAALGRAGVMACGFVLMCAGFELMGQSSNMVFATIAGLLLGTGPGLIVPTVMASVMDVAPARRRSLCSGLIGTSIFLGQFLSPLISQPIIGTHGFTTAFSIFGVAALVCAGLSVLLFRERAVMPVRA
ncbi:MFS transporter [Pseudooceanicola sp. CBS1P-1]|uniref:MFS transporter n=1 Tax=Pseudooceanicola albus TaxID=2692189 RepID=A0A6L7GBG8_9RHOB|nr:MULTISPECIES: MFS transporter [Pseudooceanicola]MBT9382933.1 MFS transporter [Pseudooceanicola endophyticus]MXN20143.1 MFS transporter [Pseudooceanicola albus]